MPILNPKILTTVAIIGIGLIMFALFRDPDSGFAPLGNPPPLTGTGVNRTASPPLSGLPPLTMERVFPNLRFSQPTNLVSEAGRLFVTEQAGRVMSFTSGPGPSEATVFLDIRNRVKGDTKEEGLLGLAFDPDFNSNGHFYVYYSAANPRRSVISRFTAGSAGPAAPASIKGVAGPDSESVVMEVPQPFQNHNGGQLAFGPDGMLYIALGDGGSGGDPQGNGQDPSTLLGSILRIDVSGLGPGQGYSVPPDNPFIDFADARAEVWAFGFRNPWRFSFDSSRGDLWAGDVGQNSFEEVDLVEKGGNYGWNTLEGNHCFSPRTDCDTTDTEPPVIEYDASKGCSIIGGYVYRGADIPALTGTYIYGDYCSGEVSGFRFRAGRVREESLLVDSGLKITSFGLDQQGEIYALAEDGGIYKLTADR